jgi:translation initiation factor 6
MPVAKLNILGNDYIGAFALSADSFSLIARGATKGEHIALQRDLEAPVHSTTVNGSDLIGIYAACNSNSVLLPEMAYSNEVRQLKKALPDVSVHVLDTDLNALGNNILANDTIAIINPNYSSKEAKHISDLLGVEVIRMGIGGFETVGANNILTNKGIVLNNAVSEKEEEELKGIFKSVSQSTANMGALSIGLCAVANSKGVVVGKSTTGYELANISDGLAVD